MRWLMLLPALTLAPRACSAGPAEFASEHFTFRYPAVDAATIAATAARTERSYAPVVSELAAAGLGRLTDPTTRERMAAMFAG